LPRDPRAARAYERCGEPTYDYCDVLIRRET
jgi:hypothetical protein